MFSLANNLVDQCGSEVTVWCSDGNPMKNRTLLTVDTFGVVVMDYSKAHAVFVPWVMIKYIDYPEYESNKTKPCSSDK